MKVDRQVKSGRNDMSTIGQMCRFTAKQWQKEQSSENWWDWNQSVGWLEKPDRLGSFGRVICLPDACPKTQPGSIKAVMSVVWVIVDEGADEFLNFGQLIQCHQWSFNLWLPYVIGRPYTFSSYGFFFFLLCFPRLISAVRDWMSTILPHMVWP